MPLRTLTRALVVGYYFPVDFFSYNFSDWSGFGANHTTDVPTFG